MSNNFNIENYVTVNDRIQAFWKDHPNGRIVTEIFHLDPAESQNRMVVIKAEVYLNNSPETPPSAVDWAKEREGIGYVSKTSFIENASTSAIGRALATLGYLVDKGRPSREEMASVAEQKAEHEATLDAIKKLATKGSASLKSKVKERWSDAKEDPRIAAALLTEVETAS